MVMCPCCDQLALEEMVECSICIRSISTIVHAALSVIPVTRRSAWMRCMNVSIVRGLSVSSGKMPTVVELG